MRTLLAGELATALAWDADYYVKLEIQNASGTWIDVGAALGHAWVIDATWQETIDQVVSQATVRLVPYVGTASLAPLMSSSPLNVGDSGGYAPLLQIGRLMRLSTATMAKGVPLDTAKYRNAFAGRIDDVQATDSSDGQGPITLSCSDLGAWLMDLEIETEGVQYGTTPVGTPLETVIQNVLNATIPSGDPAVTLLKTSASTFAVTNYVQPQQKLMEAVSGLVLDNTGEDCRYRFDASHVSQLTWFNPDRSRSTVDATIGQNLYVMSQLGTSLANVRNAGRIPAPETPGTFKTSTDAVSVALYRRRFFQLPANATLTTDAQAQTIIDAAVNDLSDAPIESSTLCPFLWFAQLYDRYTFTANDRQYDADQTMCVVGIEHKIESGKGNTTLSLTGRVLGAYAAWLKRIVAGQTEALVDILRVSETESADGKSRDFTIKVSPYVDTVHVHFRTVAVDVVGDPFDFSESADIATSDATSPLILRAPIDGSGIITFSVAHPVRGFKLAGRLIPYSAPPGVVVGASWPFAVDAAPPSVNAKLHVVRGSTTADLSIDIAFGVSDADATGVLVEVFEDAAGTETTIYSARQVAPGTIAIAGRPLPAGKDSIAWRVVITDVSGQPWGFGPASANRDPLPNGHAVLSNYRANPVFTMDFDPDTDSIRVTVPGAKTKTWDSAALALAGSPVTYTVGDALDDATTESALTVDETRSGYTVEYEGGTTWVQIGPGITLHGQPKNPPTALITSTPNTNGDAEDVTITPNTATTELLHVYFRDGSTDTALEWFACGGAADPTKLSVSAGTVLGPANFFMRVDGVGSPTAKLSALAATNDQISRYGVMIEGAESGIQSPWLPVTISLMAKPWNQSVDAVFIPATGNLHVVLVTGARCLFETVDIADNAAFTSPTTQTSTASGTSGQSISFDFALSLAQHGKKFYIRARPNNKVTGLGLDGDYQIATVDVGAAFDCQPSYAETVTTGTVTLVVTDAGAALNTSAVDGAITAAISWHVTKLGVTTVEASTTVPAGGATTGTYTKAITLDPLHPIQVLGFAHLKDGSTAPLGSWIFDSNKISDLANSDSAVSGTSGANEDFTLQWDTDTLVGANCARWSLDAGSTWTTVTVTAALLSQFSIARISSVQSMLVQAKNVIDGNWGNQATLKVSAYVSESPSLTAYYKTLTSTTGQVVWSCPAGTVLLSIDGGTASTPSASPIAITLDTSVHSYLFTATLAGVTMPAPVSVPSLETTAGTSGMNGIFSQLTNAINTYANPGLVDFTWVASGFGVGVNAEVWVRDVGKFGDQKYHIDGTTTAAAGTYTYTAGESLSNTISPFVTIGFALRAVSGSSYGTTTEPVEANYGSP